MISSLGDHKTAQLLLRKTISQCGAKVWLKEGKGGKRKEEGGPHTITTTTTTLWLPAACCHGD